MDLELPATDLSTPSTRGERGYPSIKDWMQLLKEKLAEALASQREGLKECQWTRQDFSTIVPQLIGMKLK